MEPQRQTSPREYKTWKRVSDIEDKIEEMDPSVKENVKYQKIQAQTIQKIWNSMKRPNLPIIKIEEGKETQIKGIENIFNKFIEKMFLT